MSDGREFQHTIVSVTEWDGYRILVDDAREEYGHQEGYSGAINSTSFCGCIKRFEKYSKTNMREVNKIIKEKMKDMFKRDCYCIDLGVVKYELIEVKKVRNSSSKKPKYKEKFCVYGELMTTRNNMYIVNDKPVKECDTLAEAESFALSYGFSHNEPIAIRKERVLIEGEEILTKIQIERKILKSKPSKVKENQKLVEYHEYVFFGIAPC